MLINKLVPTELVRYKDLGTWVPKIGDFIIWHGWWKRWYGLVSSIDSDEVVVIYENLPKLLFTMSESEREAHKKRISIVRIRCSRGGEYHVLQNGLWYLDD